MWQGAWPAPTTSTHLKEVEVQLVPARTQPDFARLLDAVLADAACTSIHAAAAMSVQREWVCCKPTIAGRRRMSSATRMHAATCMLSFSA